MGEKTRNNSVRICSVQKSSKLKSFLSYSSEQIIAPSIRISMTFYGKMKKLKNSLIPSTMSGNISVSEGRFPFEVSSHRILKCRRVRPDGIFFIFNLVEMLDNLAESLSSCSCNCYHQKRRVEDWMRKKIERRSAFYIKIQTEMIWKLVDEMKKVSSFPFIHAQELAKKTVENYHVELKNFPIWCESSPSLCISEQG